MPRTHLNWSATFNNVGQYFVCAIRLRLVTLTHQVLEPIRWFVFVTSWWMKHLIIYTWIVWARSLRHYSFFEFSLLRWTNIEFMSRWKRSNAVGHVHILQIWLVILAVWTHSALQFIHQLLICYLRWLRFFLLFWSRTEYVKIITVHATFALIQCLLVFFCVTRMRLDKYLRFVLILIADLIVHSFDIRLVLSFVSASLRYITFRILVNAAK